MTQTHVLVIYGEHNIDDGRITRHICHFQSHGYHVHRIYIPLPHNDKVSLSINRDNGSTIIVDVFSQYINLMLYYFALIIQYKKHVEKVVSKLEIESNNNVIVHVHETALLNIGYHLKKQFKRGYLVYDRHEVVGISHSLRDRLFKYIEWKHRLNVDGVVTTCNNHCRQVVSLFPNAKVIDVPNYPVSSDYIIDKEFIHDDNKFNTEDTIRFVNIGTLSSTYDIHLILKIAKHLLPRYSNIEFIVGGYTNNINLLSELSTIEKEYPNQFSYLGQVPRIDAIRHTQDATFGFQLLNPLSNYWVATSSNKIYEYVHCSVIPIVRAICPDEDLLRDGGLFFERTDSDEYIISTIESLILNTKLIASKKSHLQSVKSQVSFENICNNYSTLYNIITENE